MTPEIKAELEIMYNRMREIANNSDMETSGALSVVSYHLYNLLYISDTEAEQLPETM